MLVLIPQWTIKSLTSMSHTLDSNCWLQWKCPHFPNKNESRTPDTGIFLYLKFYLHPKAFTLLQLYSSVVLWLIQCDHIRGMLPWDISCPSSPRDVASCWATSRGQNLDPAGKRTGVRNPFSIGVNRESQFINFDESATCLMSIFSSFLRTAWRRSGQFIISPLYRWGSWGQGVQFTG